MVIPCHTDRAYLCQRSVNLSAVGESGRDCWRSDLMNLAGSVALVSAEPAGQPGGGGPAGLLDAVRDG
jgi:hypothetical protein